MLRRILAVVGEELAPAPGRLHDSLALAGCVLVTVFLAMALQVPESALSVYLLFFAWRDNSADGLLTAVKLIAAGSLAVVVANPLLQFVVDDPMLRLAAMCLVTFIGMYLSQASSLGELAGTAGFIFAFILTLYDWIPIPELISIGLQWIWVVLMVPMIVLCAWAILFARRPLQLIDLRLAELREAVHAPQGDKARTLLDEGLGPTDGYLSFARLWGQLRGAEADRVEAEVENAYWDLSLAEAGVSPRPGGGATRPDREGFFKDDVLSNPRYIRFGFKVVLAVLIAYAFYTVTDMFGIHTAMITCYFVALGTSGATRHKMLLRIIGCFMGAALAWLMMVFVMPHATDIGWLLLISFPAAWAAAWISLGSERISYAGWQLALCFFLVVLSGFSPPTQFTEGTDRIIGILVGCTSMFIVFTLIWPENAHDHVGQELARMDRMIATDPALRSGRDIARVRKHLAAAAEDAEHALFEKDTVALDKVRAARLRYISFVKGSFHAAS